MASTSNTLAHKWCPVCVRLDQCPNMPEHDVYTCRCGTCRSFNPDYAVPATKACEYCKWSLSYHYQRNRKSLWRLRKKRT